MHTAVYYLLSLLCCTHLQANDLTGVICDETNTPMAGVNVSLRTLKDNRIVTFTQTTTNGSFVLHDVEAGKYALLCTHVGYSDYTADLHVPNEQTFSLGTLVMYTKDVVLNEVIIETSSNVFTTDMQSITPSSRPVETSGDGLDLLQKLPIPLLVVNPISRTISSLDPSGGVALLINDIPAEPNDIAILDPKQVERVEVIRNPGMKYGQNLAVAVNIVLKQARDGVTLGVNSTNSTKITNGYNNVFASYNQKNSQLSVNQSENYQNYFHQTSDDLRQYLMFGGDWHTVHVQSLSARTLSSTHGTTLKYNLTLSDKFIFQMQGYLSLHRNPQLDRTYVVNETGKTDYTNRTHSQDRYQSPVLNLYFKKYLKNHQSFVLNVVGTHISSNYDYLYEQEGNAYQTSYGVKGRKTSVIGEGKYSKGFEWGSLTSGFRSFYGNTRNFYSNSTNYEAKMVNENSNVYVQIDGCWKQLSGSATLSLDDQYYTQQNDKYHKMTLSPRGKLNYAISPNISLGYGVNLAPRLPSLASMNDVTIQLDKWERRVGNPMLKPFNHIEHSISATYYKSNVYAMLNAVYATNKDAIMPTITRTESGGLVFFDNGAQNQRNMNQLALTAYLHYAAFNNKLVVSGTGSYNHFHADSYLYTNTRGFFSGNLKLESYLGKFYLSADVSSRYNSLFAETVWYNEYASSLNAAYKWKNFKIGMTWEQPLQRGGTNNRVVTLNNVVHKMVRQNNLEAGNHVLLTISWHWSHGIKSKEQEAELNNKDSDAGILK